MEKKGKFGTDQTVLGNKKSGFQMLSHPDLKLAVIQVKRGESKGAAWDRHLKDNPHDSAATIRVFNYPGPEGGK